MSKTRLIILLLIILASLIIISCSYTSLQTKFSAKDTKFPISITQGFYDDNYNFIIKENYVVLRHFKIKYCHNAINSHGDPLEINMSDTLKTLVNLHDCDAIVNLKIIRVNPVRNRYCYQFVSWITWLPTFSLFSPISIDYIIEGDLVRITDKDTSKM